MSTYANICSAHKIPLSYYKKLPMAGSHRRFVLWESEERFLAYEQTMPSSNSDASFYGLLNTLGCSKTYIDDQRKLNTLRHPWKENCLVWKIFAHTLLWIRSQQYSFNYPLHIHPNAVLKRPLSLCWIKSRSDLWPHLS